VAGCQPSTVLAAEAARFILQQVLQANPSLFVVVTMWFACWAFPTFRAALSQMWGLGVIALAAGAAALPGALQPDACLITAINLRAEGQTDPVGVLTRQPRLSWWAVPLSVTPAAANQSVSAFRIIGSSSQALAAKEVGDLWDTGMVAVVPEVGGRARGAGWSTLRLAGGLRWPA
jgi:hypothetical protein